MEKNLSFSTLLDYYGAALTERQRELLCFYYDDDLSLFEISENTGISRQGVRDAIKRGEAELLRLEDALGLAKSHADMRREADEIAANLNDIASGMPPETSKALSVIAERVSALADR